MADNNRDSTSDQGEQIVQQYWSKILRAASGYEARPAMRDELAQDMALAVWRSVSGFNGQCSLNTYIYRVIHNVAVDHIRRHSRTNEQELVDEIEDDNISPESDLIHSRRQQKLIIAINRLPLSLRQVILLKLEDLNNTEIGEVMGLSDSNVAVRLNRAKHKLSELLEGAEE
ncbi:sigma-70 family RNA polymerase sigma factor [Lacimicrobium sp. SS2-24]|uniref:RNA polymerase sigma factor n=1 Tax=Lacimicrobium sp. SS2-24 TaxID=2005569 RepID=UPI000B4BA552|nr:sigma-70 family RNA polymerase sigma factor [Lacimicrobium sp. SS2-24]